MTLTGRIFVGAGVLALCAATARAGHRGRGVTIDDGNNPQACSDIHVNFDSRSAARAEQRTTVLVPSAGPLKLEAARNSGIHVREADRKDFEIVLCKAAPAEADLSRIALGHAGDVLTVDGPEGDWVGYLLVTAPRAASLEVSATNGPIGLLGLSGQVHARTRNGPISVRDSAGDLDLEAQNGPIDFEGAGGKLRLRTQNGPIGVALSGDAWTGEGLDAEAINGPVSLAMPAGYRTAAVVESRGRSPFHCRGEACQSARRTWDDDHRRIELGDGPALVRLSTENGPVSVRTGQAALSDDED